MDYRLDGSSINGIELITKLGIISDAILVTSAPDALEVQRACTKLGLKVLPKSEHYERFKKGHGGEAYLRLGIFAKKFKIDVKNDAVCNCGHIKEDHHEDKDNDECLYEDCDCKKFESFQVTLLKKKKTITDIKFLQEDEVKDDSLAWNCLYVNKYKETE